MQDIEFKWLINLWAEAILVQATEENLESFLKTAAFQVKEVMLSHRYAEEKIALSKSIGQRPLSADWAQRAVTTQQLQVLVPALHYARLALFSSRHSGKQIPLSLLISHVVHHALRLPRKHGTVSPSSYRAGIECPRTAHNAQTARNLAQLALLQLPGECQKLFDKKAQPYEARVLKDGSHRLAQDRLAQDRLALRSKIIEAMNLDAKDRVLLCRFL